MANVSDLVTKISRRRQMLDQAFYEDLRKLRRQYGHRVVDQALAVWQQQRDQVAIAPKKQQERGPQFRYR